jgi:hypothetical protein
MPDLPVTTLGAFAHGQQFAPGKTPRASRALFDHPHDLHNNQAIPPTKYTLLAIPKSAICGYFVDEDEWDALSCSVVR